MDTDLQEKLTYIKNSVKENREKISQLQQFLDNHRRNQITAEEKAEIEKRPI